MLAGWRFRRSIEQLAHSSNPVLRAYAQGEWPDRKAPLSGAQFLALDFELDGLGADAHVLQAGWLPFTVSEIPLGEARSHDVRSNRTLDSQAVTIHGIGEQRARSGASLQDVIAELLEALSGRILVAHAAAIEIGALSRTARSLFGAAVPLRSICTLALEQKLSPRHVGSEAYRLGNARARYNLPPHDLHDALSDALAAAELLLAQATRLPADTRLGSLEDLSVGH